MTVAPNQTSIIRGIRSGGMRRLVTDAVRQGFQPMLDGSGHLRLTAPGGERVTLSTTVNERGRELANIRAALRRAGYRDPSERHTERKEHTPMPKGVIVSQEIVDEITIRRRRGERPIDIGAALGLNPTTVSRLTPKELRKDQAHVPQVAKPVEVQERIAALRREGKTIDEVVAIMGPDVVSTASVQKYTPEDMKRHHERPHSGPVTRILPAKPDEEEEEPAMESVADIIARTNAEFGDYPVVRSLVAKQNGYITMLKQAERMGDDDLQLVLMDKTKLKPIEAEAVRLWTELEALRKGANGHTKNGTNGKE